jgi:3-oxoacyl-[acyl-carrier-protein] synthase I
LISVSILAAGMVTAVGFNYAASCAAIRAGIKGIRVLNLWDAENGEYLSGAKVDLPQWWEGIGKLADLAAPAIWDCLEAARPDPAWGSTAGPSP